MCPASRVEGELVGLAGALHFVACLLQGAQLVVPIGLERVGDEPVGRVDAKVALASEVGFVLRAGDMALPLAVEPLAAGRKLVVHGQGDVHGVGLDGFEHQASLPVAPNRG